MATTTEKHDGDALKRRSLAKLDHARSAVLSAAHDLCNLEGHGYCDRWRDLNKLYDQIGHLHHRIADLAPPTGVFKI